MIEKRKKNPLFCLFVFFLCLCVMENAIVCLRSACPDRYRRDTKTLMSFRYRLAAPIEADREAEAEASFFAYTVIRLRTLRRSKRTPL